MIEYKGHKIFAFADTHGKHRKLHIPQDADIVICAGDAVEDDLQGDEYDDFAEWFGSLPAQWKIFVAGNHELSFDIGEEVAAIERLKKHGIIVLHDAVQVCGDVVIASISVGARIRNEDIPSDIDIVVTHHPALGILDEESGNPDILVFLIQARPQFHLFGHIHSTEGQEFMFGDTLCRNICRYNELQ